MPTNRRVPNTKLLAAVLILLVPISGLAQQAAPGTLSSKAEQAARIIGVEPLLARLTHLSEPGGPALSLEDLFLHQRITEAVVATSLDVDFVIDELAYEHAQIVELQNILLAKRQRAIGTTNLATLALSTGLGALGGVLQLSASTSAIGDKIGFVAGGLSTFLSFRGLRQQHSEGRPAWVLPSMLAPLLGDSANQQAYPVDTWAYLNSVADDADSAATRKERLLSSWRQAGRFAPLDSPEGMVKVGLLTSADATDKKLNMDLLSERAAMLADVHEEVSGMKRALSEILRDIRVSR